MNSGKLRQFLLLFLMALVLVVPGAVQAKKIKLSPSSFTLLIGQSKTMKLKNAPAGKKIKWKSSNKSVAAVTKKGQVTAKAKGQAVITAKLGKKKYTSQVTVEKPKLSKKKLTLFDHGDPVRIKMKGTKQAVKWASSNTDVALVSETGEITPRSMGTANITATVLKKKYVCIVTVEDSNTPPEGLETRHQLLRKDGALFICGAVKNISGKDVSVAYSSMTYDKEGEELTEGTGSQPYLKNGETWHFVIPVDEEDTEKYEFFRIEYTLGAVPVGANLYYDQTVITLTQQEDGTIAYTIDSKSKECLMLLMYLFCYKGNEIVDYSLLFMGGELTHDSGTFEAPAAEYDSFEYSYILSRME